mmetsp:Transcript_5539/g.9176  ORF Transcript_5539/g.9176 Transcript_5539/m.9176 type:complete len:222 (+) Transcript_5539:1168-1833(+)
MSEIMSRHMGHCCGCLSSCSCCNFELADPWLQGASSESTSAWPRLSAAACNSANSEPLKKLCRDNHPARSEHTSSRPKLVCLRRFLRILTTPTAFQTAYFRSRSTSLSMSQRCSKPSGHCSRLSPEESAELLITSVLAEDGGQGKLPTLPACFLLCSSSERHAILDSKSDCRLSKHTLTLLISDDSSCSNEVFAERASAKSLLCWQPTTSFILFLSTLYST